MQEDRKKYDHQQMLEARVEAMQKAIFRMGMAGEALTTLINAGAGEKEKIEWEAAYNHAVRVTYHRLKAKDQS